MGYPTTRHGVPSTGYPTVYPPRVHLSWYPVLLIPPLMVSRACRAGPPAMGGPGMPGLPSPLAQSVRSLLTYTVDSSLTRLQYTSSILTKGNPLVLPVGVY